MIHLVKGLDEYINNAILMSVYRSVPFIFDDAVNNAISAYGVNTEESLANQLNVLFKNGYHFLPERDFLSKGGYIKKITEPPNTFILTEKGENVQDAGGLLPFLKKINKKEKITFLKDAVTYGVTPLIAIISTMGLVYPLFKADKPLEVKQPIVLHINNLNENEIDSPYNKYDTLEKRATSK